MKYTKNNKGITLVALIITIIILLILTLVTIASVRNDGMVFYSKSAVNEWDKAKKNEQSTLNGYLNYFDEDICKGEHTFNNETGNCLDCGYACTHAKWTESDNKNNTGLPYGVCTNCGYECHHENGGSKNKYIMMEGIYENHVVQALCDKCGFAYHDWPENCTYDQLDGSMWWTCKCGRQRFFRRII